MASKRNLTLRNGTTVPVSGKVFHAQGIELIAHREIDAVAVTPAGVVEPRFGKRFVVSEPITGGLVVSRAWVAQSAAISEAQERMARPGAADHIRHKISLN